MTLSAGERLGPYEILAPLGAGGMGEVYKARDTRLERTVAVKVLPPHMSESPELKQRFEREAKAISQLTHPHICTLYDVGSQDGVEYLVMELLEGDTLADRLGKGALPRDQVIRCGIEITEALEKAHRAGIIHRDLKPGNIMLTKSGVKLLDFGLAKMMAGPVLPAEASSLPTQGVPSQPLTEKGTVMGTFQYMAPEQLEGAEADARTDIFALGTVLYEMATGRKAFTGKSRVSLIGSILKDEPPPISSVRPMTPPALDRLVQACLAKEPDDRFQTAHDVKLQLRWIVEGGSQADAPTIVAPRRRARERVWAALAVLLALALIASFVHQLSQSRIPLRRVQTSILPPEKAAFVANSGPMALAPDGTRLAFIAATADGKQLLWIRPLDGLSAQPLAGTEDAGYPFWSPDGRYIGFSAAGALKKVDVSGGPPQALCDSQNIRGGTWNREGVLIFAPVRGPLLRVSSAGGAPAPLTELDASKGEFSHRFPFFLPDGRHYIYLAQSTGGDPKERNVVYAGSLDSKERKLLLRPTSNAIYAPTSAGASTGYLLYARGETVVAQPFDAKGLSLAGEATPIGESVTFFGIYAYALFTASNSGTFAYQAGGARNTSQLVWFDRTGKQLGVVGPPADYARPRLSHDGRRVAIDMVDPQTGRSDIWVVDLGRNVSTRLTFGPVDNFSPVWSPDDGHIAFRSGQQFGDIYEKASSGTGDAGLLVGGDKNFKNPSDWSPDGKLLLYYGYGSNTSKATFDIFTFSLGEKAVTAFLATPATEALGVFSPDGRWLTYVSDESGRRQVYVQAFPPAGGKWQISTAGGTEPVWSRDGKELFYLALDQMLMAVDIKTGSGFEAGSPRVLFEARSRPSGGRQYDVSSDGRFLINTVIGDTKAIPITLVQNWAAELEKK